MNRAAPADRLDRYLRWALLGGVALMFLALSIQQIWSADFWWQLRTGQWVVQHGSVPRLDDLSYSVRGHEWIEVRWLFFALSYLGWTIGGPALLILAQTAILAAAGWIVIAPSRRGAGTPVGALILILATWSASGRFIVRPELVSFLMVALFVTALDRHRRGAAPRAVWALPLAQVIWTNTHTLFALGPVIAWLFVAGRVVERALGMSGWSAARMGGRSGHAGSRASRPQPVPRGAGLDRGRVDPAGEVRLPGRRDSSKRGAVLSTADGGGRKGSAAGRQEDDARERAAGIKGQALLASLVTAACLVNPYGLRGAAFPLLLWREMHAGSIVGRAVEELRSPFAREAWGWELWAWAALVVVSAVTFLLNRRRTDPSRLIVWGAFLYLAGQSVRNMALFAFVAAWASLRNLEEGMDAEAGVRAPGAGGGEDRRPEGREWGRAGGGDDRNPAGGAGSSAGEGQVPGGERSARAPFALRIPPAGTAAARAVLLAAALGGAWYVATDRYAVSQGSEQSSGLGVAPWSYPRSATEFLLASGATPQLFQEMSDGSYLAWKAQGRFPVFIDGRNEVYGEPFINEYLAVAGGGRDWDAFADRWGINTALLHRERSASLAALVQLSPRWALVHVDERDLVFVRDIPAHAELIRKYRVDPAKPWTPRGPEPEETPRGWRAAIGSVGRPWYTLGMAKSFLLLGSVNNAAAYLERARAAFPSDREARGTLAQIYRSRGRDADAERLLAGLSFSREEEVRKEELLADLYRIAGRLPDAAAPLERAVALAPADGALRGKLARVRLETKDYARAVEAYREALRLAPANPTYWTELGHSLAMSRRTDEALAAYRTSLKYSPAQFDIQFNVGILLARKEDFAGAAEAFRQSLRIRPDYAPAREALERLAAGGRIPGAPPGTADVPPGAGR